MYESRRAFCVSIDSPNGPTFATRSCMQRRIVHRMKRMLNTDKRERTCQRAQTITSSTTTPQSRHRTRPHIQTTKLTCQGPLSLTTSCPSPSTCTSASLRIVRRHCTNTSSSAPTNQGRGYHFVGVLLQASDARSVQTIAVPYQVSVTLLRRQPSRTRTTNCPKKTKRGKGRYGGGREEGEGEKGRT